MVNWGRVACTFAWLIVFVIGSSMPMSAAAQTASDTSRAHVDVDAAVDHLLQYVDAEEGEVMLEELLQLVGSPIDITTASVDEISQLPSITRLQAARLVTAQRDAEAPLSATDVRLLLDISEHHLEVLLPFFTLEPPQKDQGRTAFWHTLSRGNWGWEWTQRTTRRLDLPRGYDDIEDQRAYQGGPARQYVRMRASQEHVRMNLTLDNSAGEPFRWDPKRRSFGFQHQAAFVHFQSIGAVESLILGDFSVSLGEGLALWGLRLGGASANPLAAVSSSGRGIAPFGSSMRNESFRGVATSVNLSNSIRTSLFYSNTRRDARIDTLREGTTLRIQTPGISHGGYYRTESEIGRKSRLPEQVVGGAIEYSGHALRLGTTAYHSRFGAEIAPVEAPHNDHDFRGDRATMISGFARWSITGGEIFGELARASAGTIAGVAGAQAQLARHTAFAVSARLLPANFDGLYGSTFAASGGNPQNESGIYMGIRVRPHDHWIVDGYVDHHQFPWLRHHFRQPSTGFDRRLTLRHEPYRWLSSFAEIRFRMREERFAVTDRAGRSLIAVHPEYRQSIRTQTSYQFSPPLRMQVQASAARVHQGENPAETGVLLYTDLRFQPLQTLRIDTRLTFFDTDGYAARLYAYESDLLYAFNLPPLYGTGQRAYVMATWQPERRLYLQLKYSATRYRNVSSFGSGWGETEGDRLREVRAQFRIRF